MRFCESLLFYARRRGSEWLFEHGICAEGRGEDRHGSQLDRQAHGSTQYGSCASIRRKVRWRYGNRTGAERSRCSTLILSANFQEILGRNLCKETIKHPRVFMTSLQIK